MAGWRLLGALLVIFTLLGCDLEVQLVDASTNQVMANADVTVSTDTGVHCVRAPCPQAGRKWRGQTNGQGRITIPSHVLDGTGTTLFVEGYTWVVIRSSTSGKLPLSPRKPKPSGKLPLSPRKPERLSAPASIWGSLVVVVRPEHEAVIAELRLEIASARQRSLGPNERDGSRKIVSKALASRILETPGFELVPAAKIQGRRSLWTSANPKVCPGILMYRIRWFNGRLSKWYIPGVNDRDWKAPAQRVWRYFQDHDHEIIRVGKGPACIE